MGRVRTACARLGCAHSITLHLNKSGGDGLQWSPCTVKGCTCEDYIVSDSGNPVESDEMRTVGYRVSADVSISPRMKVAPSGFFARLRRAWRDALDFRNQTEI